MENNQPIIIKRVKRIAGGHHGGAWKIAFADFATAMMAFFLVLWLLSTATPEQKIAIAGYFKDPVGFSESGTPYIIDLGGTPTLAPENTLNPEVKSQPQPDKVTVDTEQVEGMAEQVEKERLELLLQELQNKVDENPQLQKFKDQILFEITQDGLRIQIMDAENRPMFDSGSARLKPYFEDILLAMADTIKAVPNKISISGHTDAKPYTGTGEFGNWELSANRANAARRALVAGSYTVTLEGPSAPVMIRKKSRQMGIWINTESVGIAAVPSYYAVASSAPLSEILTEREDQQERISPKFALRAFSGPLAVEDARPFTEALLRIREAEGQFSIVDSGVQVQQDTLFRVDFDLPANLTEGDYKARVFLLRNGEVIDRHRAAWGFFRDRRTDLYGALVSPRPA